MTRPKPLISPDFWITTVLGAALLFVGVRRDRLYVQARKHGLLGTYNKLARATGHMTLAPFFPRRR